MGQVISLNGCDVRDNAHKIISIETPALSSLDRVMTTTTGGDGSGDKRPDHDELDQMFRKGKWILVFECVFVLMCGYFGVCRGLTFYGLNFVADSP